MLRRFVFIRIRKLQWTNCDGFVSLVFLSFLRKQESRKNEDWIPHQVRNDTIMIKYFLIIIILFLQTSLLYAEDAKSHYEKGATYLMNAALVHTIERTELINSAISEFKEAIRLNPKYTEAYYDLGLAYRMKGRDVEAIRFFKKTIEIKPDFIDALFQLGDIYYKKRQYNSAVAEYKRIIEIDSKKTAAYANIGRTYIEMKDYSSALLYLRKGLEIDSGHLDLHFYLGNLYYQNKEYDKAIDEYKIMLKELPEEGRVYYRLGLAYRKKGSIDLAEDAFKKTIEHSPFTDEEAVAIQELLEIRRQHKIRGR